MTITMDLYKQLNIERAWDEKKIKETLKSRQHQWIMRQNACNDKKELLIIEDVMKAIGQAFQFLTKPNKRKQYDKALEEAYKNGTIKDDVEDKLNSILDQALEYFRKGNIKLAAHSAKEAIDGKINNPLAWNILARCFYDTKQYTQALDIIDRGVKVFDDDIDLNWLGARIATVGTNNYEDAQRRINRLLEIAPNQAIGYSEQIFLHFTKGEEALAFQEIDKYIEEQPNDNEFKKNAAYNVINFSNTSYVKDPKSGVYIIADKQGYERCLKMREKAQEIYQDEYTEQQVEKARYFGTLEFNKDNLNDLLWMYGTFLYVFIAVLSSVFDGTEGLFAFAAVCLALAVPPVILTAVSFRPYWQLNRIYLTGDPGLLETIVVKIGRVYTWAIKKALWLLWKLFKFAILVLIRICTR